MTGSNEAWLNRHGAYGILHHSDVADMRSSTRRVFELMSDGLYHTPDAIERAAGENGIPARGGARRMRDLRAIPGVTVERKHVGGRRYVYKMVVKAHEQGRLFRP